MFQKNYIIEDLLNLDFDKTLVDVISEDKISQDISCCCTKFVGLTDVWTDLIDVNARF